METRGWNLRLLCRVQDGLVQMILAEDILGEKEEESWETIITIHSLLSI